MTYTYTPPVYKNVNRTAQIGDLVRIKQGFWCEGKSEYTGQLAVIKYTYKSQYNGREEREEHQLGISTQNNGESAWWSASSFDFIESDRLDLIDVWEKKKILKQRRLKNYTFLAKHLIGKGDKVGIPTPCIAFLWEQVNPNRSMWGRGGEGVTHFQNQMQIWTLWLMIATSFKQPVTKRNWREFRKHIVNETNEFKRLLESKRNDSI